jgi:hypothetical protein
MYQGIVIEHGNKPITRILITERAIVDARRGTT